MEGTVKVGNGTLVARGNGLFARLPPSVGKALGNRRLRNRIRELKHGNVQGW